MLVIFTDKMLRMIDNRDFNMRKHPAKLRKASFSAYPSSIHLSAITSNNSNWPATSFIVLVVVNSFIVGIVRPPLCLQTPFTTPEMVTTIPRGQTAFFVFRAETRLPGEELWTSYNQNVYTDSTGALLDL